MLYVANCTMQDHDFIYRVPESNKLTLQRIPIGGQIVVLGQRATLAELTGIIEQHKRYGLRDVKEIDQTKDFTGLVYSFDKPVPIEKIMHVNAANADVTERNTREWRKQNAVALSNELRNRHDIGRLRNLQVEVEEERSSSEAQNKEVIEVLQEGIAPRAERGMEPSPPPARRGRRKAV